MNNFDLERYNKVCEVSSSPQRIPPCYPVMAIFSFQPMIVSLPSFPVSPLGVVHIRTIILQHKEISIGSTLKYEINLNGHRNTDRGLELDFVIKASLESDEVVWECLETMLSRKHSGGSKKRTENKSENNQDFESKIISISSDTGLRYAKVTGDYNLHHLNKFTSRLVGFSKPIAHGQWSIERCISLIHDEGFIAVPPFKIDCHLKLPVYMPSKCLVQWKMSKGLNEQKTIEFQMKSHDGKLPHLTGSLLNLNSPGSLLEINK